MTLLTAKAKRAYRFSRRAYRFAVRRLLKKDLTQRPTEQTRDHFRSFLLKIKPEGKPLICILGSLGQEVPGREANYRYAEFDISSEHHVLDLMRNEQIDAFYLNKASPRDLVNLTNFLGAYDLDIPVLIGEQFRCQRLIGYTPFMPKETISTSIRIHHYFSRNYRINDTLLCQGYLYEGMRLVDSHQFLIKPEETKVFDLQSVLNIGDTEAGMYYLEVIHPQLPTSTSEHRFFGLYHDESSGYMAGTHALPLGHWHNFSRGGFTATRTFLPNVTGISARYIVPAGFPNPEGAEINASTTQGNQVVFTASKGSGSIESTVPLPNPADGLAGLEFDRVSPGLPTLGYQGYQTLWLKGSGLAVWHDGGSVKTSRNIRPENTMVPTARRKLDSKTETGAPVLFDERQQARDIRGNMIELYESRARYFLTVFPFLGHEHPDLNVVFDIEQWTSDLTKFDISFSTNDGVLVDTKPFRFNGPLQTVNLNALFSERLAEFEQGYWTITADPIAQGAMEEAGSLRYPGGKMLFGFWGDKARIYDSVHSQESRNSVAFDLHQPGASEQAKTAGRVVSRCRKFAPFIASEGRTSWFWVCNVGYSEEKIDAQIKVRLYDNSGQEGVASYFLPADSTRTLSAEELLRDCKVDFEEGTVWLESNDCNLGAIWFVQAGDGKGFATDHFTGG